MRRRRTTARLAFAGALTGLVAGLAELTIGPSIRSLVGDKLDTTRLGLTTMLLGVVALTAAIALRREERTGGRRLAVAAGLAVPGLVGFTTVGDLWLLPGPLLLGAGGLVLAASARSDLTGALDERHLLVGMVALCGVYYVFLGATALGVAGALGVLGGLLIWAAMAATTHSHAAALALLTLGTLPFAVATWWSVLTPLVALLALVTGALAVRLAPSADERLHHAGRAR